MDDDITDDLGEMIDVSQFTGQEEEDTGAGNKDVLSMQRSFSQKQVGSIAEFVEPVSAFSSMDDLIDIFENTKTEAIPVEEYDHVVGVIERRDMEVAMGTAWKRFTAGNVSEHAKRIKSHLHASDFIEQTLHLVSEVNKETGVRHFPVFNGRSFFGMVSLEGFLARIAQIREQDLSKAAAIQQSYFPGNVEADKVPYKFVAFNRMANALGGDFYQVHQFPNGSSVICCFDVSGKNVAASLLTMTVGSYFKMLTMTAPESSLLLHPSSIVATLDGYLARSVPAGNFITAMMCFVDAQGKTLHLFNCGHTLTYLIFTEGEYAGKMTTMPPALPPLGMGAARDAIKNASSTEKPWTAVNICKGLHLDLYSDGFTDMKDDVGERYEDDRAKKFFVKLSTLPQDKVHGTVESEVDEWIKGSMIPDDITVLDVRF